MYSHQSDSCKRNNSDIDGEIVCWPCFVGVHAWGPFQVSSSPAGPLGVCASHLGFKVGAGTEAFLRKCSPHVLKGRPWPALPPPQPDAWTRCCGSLPRTLSPSCRLVCLPQRSQPEMRKQGRPCTDHTGRAPEVQAPLGCLATAQTSPSQLPAAPPATKVGFCPATPCHSRAPPLTLVPPRDASWEEPAAISKINMRQSRRLLREPPTPASRSWRLRSSSRLPLTPLSPLPSNRRRTRLRPSAAFAHARPFQPHGPALGVTRNNHWSRAAPLLLPPPLPTLRNRRRSGGGRQWDGDGTAELPA